MVSRFTICDQTLTGLVMAGRASSHEVSQFEQHLQHCVHCRQQLENLSGGNDWSVEVKEFLSADDACGLNSAGELSEIDCQLESGWLKQFLEPSADPNKLGTLGVYEIERVIGRGGFGIVLQAYEPALQRRVAIKILAAHLATNGAARKRFAREAQAAAAVVHDHVIPIYAVDSNGKMPFLVMPFVNGQSLRERIHEEGSLEVREILRIGRQVALGLLAAHNQGLIHRDIKPANILLENGIERVRITDFGLARAADDASQTQSGFVAGTPQYMSPEQARGEIVDHRTDLFSLGSVMYCMSTGHPPFRAEKSLAILKRICEDSARPVRDVNPEIPGPLAWIIDRLLAKSPSERFSSAEELAELLEQYLAHLQQPTLIPLPEILQTPTVRGEAFWRKQLPFWRVASGVAVTCLVTWLIFARWFPESFFDGANRLVANGELTNPTSGVNDSRSREFPSSVAINPKAQPVLELPSVSRDELEREIQLDLHEWRRQQREIFQALRAVAPLEIRVDGEPRLPNFDVELESLRQRLLRLESEL